MTNEPYNGNFWGTKQGIIIQTWINGFHGFVTLRSMGSPKGAPIGISNGKVVYSLGGGGSASDALAEIGFSTLQARAALDIVTWRANEDLKNAGITDYTFEYTDIVNGGLWSITELTGPVNYLPEHFTLELVELFNAGFAELGKGDVLNATLDSNGRLQLNGDAFSLQSVGIQDGDFGTIPLLGDTNYDKVVIPSLEVPEQYGPSLIIDGSDYTFSSFRTSVVHQIEYLLDQKLFNPGPVISQVDPDTGFTTKLYTAIDDDGDFIIREVIIKTRNQNGDPEDYIERHWVRKGEGGNEMTWLKSRSEHKKPLEIDPNEIVQEDTKFVYDHNTVRILNDIFRQDGSLEQSSESRIIKYNGREIEELVVVGSRVTKDETGAVIDKDLNVSVEGLDITKPYLGPRQAQYISGSQIGSILGSAIGSQLSGTDTFAQLTAGTVIGAIGKNLGQLADQALGIDLGRFADGARKEVFADFGVDLKVAAAGAVSSFLVAELINALGVDGVAGELLNTTGGVMVGQIAENIALGVDAFSNVGNLDILGGAIASYLGSKLASQIISFDTVGGQIGSSVGAAAGAIIFTKAFETLGNFLAPGIGAFVGFIIGGLVGSLFGGTPRSAADVVYNPETGEFGVDNVWSAKGGSKETAENLAAVAAANLNGVLAAIGGTVITQGRVSGGTYGTRKSDYTYRVDGGAYGPGDPGKQTIARTFDGDDENATTYLIEHGVVNALDDLMIAGGDVFLKRSLYGSLDTVMTGDNVNAAIQGEAINVIMGNFQTASDYRTYIENAATINALIAAEPESAFTAGWIITLQRAGELGLNKRHAADWLGGYQAWAVENDVASFGALALNPYINALGQSDRRFMLTDGNGFTRRIYDTVTMSSKDVISGTNGADIITITGDTLTGNTAFTVNGVVSDGSDFQIDIAATVHGGDGDDLYAANDNGLVNRRWAGEVAA